MGKNSSEEETVLALYTDPASTEQSPMASARADVFLGTSNIPFHSHLQYLGRYCCTSLG